MYSTCYRVTRASLCQTIVVTENDSLPATYSKRISCAVACNGYTFDFARGFLGDIARFLVVQNAVDAALLVAKTQGGAGRAAARATALATFDGAARYAAVVLAFDSSDSVAAFKVIGCVRSGVVGKEGEEL